MAKFYLHDSDEFQNKEFQGAVLGLSNKAYHDMHDSWSSTALKYMYSTSPFHFKAKYIDRVLPSDGPSPQMLLGSLVHMYVLTPDEFDKDYIVMPEVDLRTKEGKAARAFTEDMAVGRQVVPFSVNEEAKIIAKNVMANAGAFRLLTGGEPEVSCFWTCPFSGLKFRSKIDYVGKDYFVELKTTKSAEPRTFERHAFNMHYELSLCHYAEGLRVLGLEDRKPCYFIVVETSAPYAVQVYRAGASLYDVGHQKWLDAVTKLEAGVKQNLWPGYIDHLVVGEAVLEAPKWAMGSALVNEEI